jgi:hypothetical protein
MRNRRPEPCNAGQDTHAHTSHSSTRTKKGNPTGRRGSQSLSYGSMGSSKLHAPPAPMYGMCRGVGAEGATKGNTVTAPSAPGGTGELSGRPGAGSGTFIMKPGTLTGLNRLGVKGPTILTRRLSVTRDIMTYSRPGEKASRTWMMVCAARVAPCSMHEGGRQRAAPDVQCNRASIRCC